ncbi:MAG: hypothetical protein IPP66_03400 [Anaerolineales bacterium]|nr:hypothetical protein [Anaerolineales bacterium]
MEVQTLPSLRPLRLGELLDQAIRLYRRNFLTFIGIIAVVYVPVTILQTAAAALLSNSMLDRSSLTSQNIFQNSGYWIGLLSIFILAFVQVFLVQGVATSALARAMGNNYLGRKVGIVDAYVGIGRSWLSLFGALLFLGIIFFIIVLWWVIVPCVGWFTGFGMIVFLTGAIAPLVAPAVILEGQGAIEGVRRAWSLARRRFWPLLGYIFVLYLFSFIIVRGPAAIVSAVLSSTMQSFDNTTNYVLISTIVQSFITLITTLLYYPLQMSAFTLIYFDLRVRTEGFDIALSTMQLDPANDTQTLPAPPPATEERFMTGTDLGNFAILTLGAAGVYILFVSLIMGSVFFISSLFGR